MLHPAWRSIFRRAMPRVRLLDVKEDVNNLTTYTFSACNVGDLGTTMATQGDTTTDPYLRTKGKKIIFVIVHGEDAALTFGISGVTLGGVAGQEWIDRGGGTSAINTGIYAWDTAGLGGITNTDIAVTFTEAVTGCAIGVVVVENIGVYDFVSSDSSVGTGSLGLTPNYTDPSMVPHMFMIFGTTCATGGGTERAQFDFMAPGFGAGWGVNQLELLYEGSNAEFDYAGGFALAQQYMPDDIAEPIAVEINWSGTGAGDSAAAMFK